MFAISRSILKQPTVSHVPASRAESQSTTLAADAIRSRAQVAVAGRCQRQHVR